MGKDVLNVEYVVKNKLCTGCGTCVGICPSSAIKLKKQSDGYLPQIDYSKCKNEEGCRICFEVCPGHSIELNQLSVKLFNDTKKDVNIGRFIECYTGYSTDYNIRYHSASGGVVSQLLIYLLEKRLIDGALVTRMHEAEPLEPEVIIARTKDEVLEAKSSKYCPVPLGVGLREVLQSDGRFAVVGLPCHIHGFRKAETLFPRLKEKVYIYLGIYCSGGRTFGATEYLLKNRGICPGDVTKFAYRDEGWLGSMVIETKDGRTTREAYINYYHSLRSFFIPFRCTLCRDHFAELADISLGDIYIPEFWDDKIGTTSIVVRSKRGSVLLTDAGKAAHINLKPLEKVLLIKSQRRSLPRKKRQTAVRASVLRLLGRKLPEHDCRQAKERTRNKIRYLVSTVILYSEMAIGKRRWLWFTIKYLNSLARKVKKS